MTPSRALQVRTPAVPGLLTAFALLIVAGCDGSPSTAPTEVVVVNPTAAVVSSQMTASAVVGSTLVDFNGLTAGQRIDRGWERQCVEAVRRRIADVSSKARCVLAEPGGMHTRLQQREDR